MFQTFPNYRWNFIKSSFFIITKHPQWLGRRVQGILDGKRQLKMNEIFSLKTKSNSTDKVRDFLFPFPLETVNLIFFLEKSYESFIDDGY